MSEGLPTDDQLRRIERGVQRRIDARRRLARRVAGAAAAVVLVGGGFALVLPLATGASGGGSAGSAAGTAAGGSSAVEVVRCHATSRASSAVVEVEADAGSSAAQAAAACGAVDFQRDETRMPSAVATPSTVHGQGASQLPRVVCRASDGALHVFPADARPGSLCERDGMRPA